MAVITPQTDVYLIKCPLEINDINQLTFANAQAQFKYFNSLPKIPVDNFTYQRKDGTMRFGMHFDDLISYNYVMYRNDAYSSKWFYAFITDMQYLNDNVTAITIKTDVWQTWQFDLTYKRVFVEREHTNNDAVGANTIPENLELGEYEIVDLRNSPMYEDSSASADWLPCFVVTKFPSSINNLGDNGEVQGSNGYIGGVFNSLHFFAVDNLNAGKKVIEIYDNDSSLTSDAIVNIYMIPRCCANILQSGSTTLQGHSLRGIRNFWQSDVFQLQQPNVLSQNYRPVNAKLLTYPFSYFYVTNNVGEEVTYRYEDFPFETINGIRRRTMSYQKVIIPSASLSAKLYFTNYKAYSDSESYGTKMYNYGVNYGKVPVCAWTTDYYTNWLTQNGVNVAMSTGLGVASALLNPNPIGGAMSLASTIGNTIGEIHRAETTPPQAHGDINTGDLLYAMKRNSISFYEMSIRPEYARVIDEYFSAYGYATHRVKLPNITGRRNWNYVKTQGCYIDADIPQDDLAEIKGMFDRGITFWHNPATFADYSQNNDII